MYLHFYTNQQLDWWNLVFLMIFWHLLLKFLKFPSRHATFNSNLISLFVFIYIYKIFWKPYYYTQTLKILSYSIFLIPILQYSIVTLNFQYFINYFFGDIFIFWLLFLKNSINKILIVYFSFITYQYILLLFCFNLYFIENLHFIGFCFVYLTISLPDIYEAFLSIFNLFINNYNTLNICVKNYYYFYFYKIYILYFCFFTLFFLTACFLFVNNLRWIFIIRILS